MLEFKTLRENSLFTETEKRSKFISYAFSVSSEEEVKGKLNSIKSEHWDARHIVYAYRLVNNIERYSDDGEPSGTAGLPVMNAIRSFDLQNILVVVVRYFGGILLGTSGLRKMYGSGAIGVLKQGKIATLVLCKHLIIYSDYKDYSKISHILSRCKSLLVNTEYADKIKLDVFVRKDDLDLLLKECKDYEILEDDYKNIL